MNERLAKAIEAIVNDHGIKLAALQLTNGTIRFVGTIESIKADADGRTRIGIRDDLLDDAITVEADAAYGRIANSIGMETRIVLKAELRGEEGFVVTGLRREQPTNADAERGER